MASDAKTREECRDMSLYEKLLRVQGAVTKVQKLPHKPKGGGQGMGYDFVSSSQVLDAVRGEMDDCGLLLAVEVEAESVTFDAIHYKNGDHHLTELVFRFTWINVDKPTERESYRWYAQGTDNAEKGAGKAMTYGEKYFLLKFFHIATDSDDPDAQEFQEPVRRQTPAARPAPSPAPAQPRSKAASEVAPLEGEDTGPTFEDVGHLFAALTELGYHGTPKRNALKEKLGMKSRLWPDLTGEQRTRIYLAARTELAHAEGVA